MTVRPLRDSDIPILKTLAESSGLPYPDLSGPLIEAIQVVVDDDGQPIMAAAAQRIIELYLIVSDQGMHPASKLHALRLLHGSMAAELRSKGYSEANSFLPPTLAQKFGRRLEKSFGWIKNWPSWCKRF